jgi:thiamine pyrophosphate-dependent acetolactate synthase large subunit-like protein
MGRNASEIVVDTLIAWGVDTVFGMAGDGINGVVEALRTRQDRIRFVSVRHEESAAFMATAHAKWTGKLGCCMATTGPGGLHLLNGLYDAKLDLVPVVALTGLPYHDIAETFTQQDVPLDRVFADVAAYNARVMGAAHAEAATSLACRSALAHRGVAHLALAVDVQEEEEDADQPSPRGAAQTVSTGWTDGLRVPEPDAVARAAALLNGAQRVAILAGRGALGARAELEQTAQLLGAPVAKALLGKAVMPDDHPLTTGGIGLYGTFGTHAAMAGCDALLIVGSTFPYVEYYPEPGQARCVQIDRDPQRIGLRHAVDVGLVGDARAALEMLNARLQRKKDRSFLEDVQAEARRWTETQRAAEESRQMPMHPAVPVAALGRKLPPTRWWSRTPATTPARRAARHVRAWARLRRLGPARLHGLRAALRHRRRPRLPGPAGLRRGGGRRPRNAARRVRHRRAAPPEPEAPGDPQRHPRADQVGADAVPRQPGIRLRGAADRLRPRGRGHGRARLHHRGAGAGGFGAWMPPSPRRGRSSSRRSWTRTSRCCPPGCPSPTPSTCTRRSKPARRGAPRSSGRWSASRRAP